MPDDLRRPDEPSAVGVADRQGRQDDAHGQATHVVPGADFDGHPLPLGAVVAVADLIDCVPIVDASDQRDEAQVIVGFHDGGAFRSEWPGGAFRCTDQVPLGDFTPGRWAWLLDNIRPLAEPVPAKGRLGLWRPDADLAARCEAVADG